MEYLINDICNLNFLNKNNFSSNKNINIISICFFKMKNHYKNFNIYINGLKKWIKFLKSFKNNYIIRLFIDENVKNDEYIMKIINESEIIQPILFNCINYKKGNFHIDLFATMVRFFPIFNFNNNDSNNVILADVDLHEEDFIKIKTMLTNNFNSFFGLGFVNDVLIKNKPYIFAGCTFFPNKKYNKNIIIDFIKNIKFDKNKGYYNKRFTEWGFGVDEIFINNYLINNIDEFGILFDYQLSYFMYHDKDKILNSKNSKKFLKLIIGKYYKENMTLEDMYNFIDKNTYRIYNYTDISSYLTKRFCSLLKFLKNNKKKWMSKIYSNFIIEYLDNIISAVVKINYNNKLKKINDVNLYKKIETDLI